MLFSWFQEGCNFSSWVTESIPDCMRRLGEAGGGSAAGQTQMPRPQVENSRALCGFWEKHEEVGMAKKQ